MNEDREETESTEKKNNT